MCGISGIYGLKSTDVAYRYVTGMNDAIAHRGPDDDGLFVEENIALGHRRLAILDLSPAGHQPMFDHYENLCIVFNGEIYNYIELKEDLKKVGYQFKTTSDTEVILAAYDHYKEKVRKMEEPG